MAYQFAKGYPKGEFLLPSVTKIIGDCTDKSRALTQWSANQVVAWIKLNCAKSRGNFPHYKCNDEQLNQARFNFREVSDEALAVGSAVHAAIEEYLLTGKEPNTDHSQVVSGFLAFLEFFDEHEMEAISVEQKVYGNYWAGTLDYFGWFKPDKDSPREKWVLDWKASKAHYAESHGPQIVAYASVVPECETRCGVVLLHKETGFPDFKDYTKKYSRYLSEFNLMVPLFMVRHPRLAKAANWKGLDNANC